MAGFIIGIGVLLWWLTKSRQPTQPVAAPKPTAIQHKAESSLLAIIVGIIYLAFLLGLLYGLVHLVKWMWAN